MVSEKEIKYEDDIWSLNNIKKFALASVSGEKKKKNEKQILIAVKKSLLHEFFVTENAAKDICYL